MADKCDTYYCTWKRNPDGTYVGWEISKPKLRATAFNPNDLMEALGDVVGKFHNDHEAAIHFDPPLSQMGDPAWYANDFSQISWNAGFSFDSMASTVFSEGRCKRCGGGLGVRTARPLEVDRIDDATDGASSPQSNSTPPSRQMPGRLMIVSADFLNALTKQERKTFDTRRVKWSKRGRQRQFFELIPHTIIPLGAIVGLEVNGWRCDRCNRRVYSHGGKLGWCVNVTCRKYLPTASTDFFFAGSQTNVNLYCTRERWRTFAGKKWARKLTGEALAVVDEPQFILKPLLGTLDEIAEFRRKHGFKAHFKPKPPRTT